MAHSQLARDRDEAVQTDEPRYAMRLAAPRIATVTLFAIAMAYVESASVLYLRTIYGGIDPVGPRHPPFDPLPDFVWIEIGREAATMVMLAAVGWLAARGAVARFGAFALAMGVWDVFYYVFLRVFSGWPASLVAPDVLFLIPLPWWGPVLAPVLAALAMSVGGAVAIARDLGDGIPYVRRDAWLPVLIGVIVCLIAFMWDALQALPNGIEAAYYARGGPFPWGIFLVGIGIGGAGMLRTLTSPHQRQRYTR